MEVLGYLPSEKTDLIRSSLRRFAFWSLAMCTLFVIFFAIARQYELREYEKILQMHQAETIAAQKMVISNLFVTVEGDLLFLSEQNELMTYLENGDESLLRAVQNEFVSLGERKPAYEQIRFIDEHGMEKVRVNTARGKAWAVPSHQLQNKGKRYYFPKTLALDHHEIYVSPLDLNIEYEQIETPYKPMIRFATPVYDRSMISRGIVIINVLGAALLEQIRTLGEEADFKTLLLNREGYWLIAPDSGMEWGFMLPERALHRFPVLYPQAWQAMTSAWRGSFRLDSGLYSYEQVCMPAKCSEDAVAQNSAAHSKPGPGWILIDLAPAEILASYDRTIITKFLILGGLIVTIVGYVIWMLAWSVSKRDILYRRLKLMALRDPLTSLYNRRALAKELREAIEHAARFRRRVGLLYIDLDGFKAVNDTHGHEAGDELLIEISRRLALGSRKSDCCARLGGDEFVCLLREIESAAGAMLAAEHILEDIRRPVRLPSGEVIVGASIGVAVYPEHGRKVGILLNSADKAMFQAKKKGKNLCLMAEEKTA